MDKEDSSYSSPSSPSSSSPSSPSSSSSSSSSGSRSTHSYNQMLQQQQQQQEQQEHQAQSNFPSYLSFLDSHIKIPRAWSPKDKCQLLSLSKQNCRVSYNGPGKNESAALRGNCSIPPQCGVYYFEIEIISKGRDGYIGIGICEQTVKLNKLPGWEPSSFGYHADDGFSFFQSGTGTRYGPVYTTGDIVGCGVNFSQKNIFFTKNGVWLGVAFSLIDGVFFPTVGLRTPGEIVEANFGQKPFVFDIETFIRDEKQKLLEKINSLDLSSFQGSSSINSLIQSYLIHHGYSETAKIFSKSVIENEVFDGNEEEVHMDINEDFSIQTKLIKQRREISECVLAGEIGKAIELTEYLFPTVFQMNPKILFTLRCRQFIEIIRKGKTSSKEQTEYLIEAMKIGQQLQNEYGKREDEEIKTQLEETFSLLAYSDPFSSPFAGLLHVQARELVANSLNSAILVSQNFPATPPLESLIIQSTLVSMELQEYKPSFLNVFKDFVYTQEENHLN